MLKATRRKFQWRSALAGILIAIGASSWFYNSHITQIKRTFNKADQAIITLDYDSAAVLLMQASKSPIKRKEAAQKMLEIVFFYNEIGETSRALSLFQDTGLTLNSNGKVKDLLASLKEKKDSTHIIREALKVADPSYYQDSLMSRYFPEMIEVEGGTFWMGSDSTDQYKQSDEDLHEVTVSDFKMAKTETTIWQFSLFAYATDRSYLLEEQPFEWMGNTPVVDVSWYEAIAYANWLSERMEVSKVYQLADIPDNPNTMHNDSTIQWVDIPNWEAHGFRLPTEAEWEYAARGV